jgi:hypothetical protein
MIYTLPLTLPKNTPATALASDDLTIPPGTVNRVFITFPDGCAGLASVRVVVREHILWPTNSDQWFTGNNYTFSFDEALEIRGDSERFRFEGYNLDGIYPHTVYFILSVLPPSAISILDLLNQRPVVGSGVGG